MHLLTLEHEPNTQSGKLAEDPQPLERGSRATSSAPVEHVDWRQHYPHRHWSYDSLLEALSAAYERVQDRAQEAGPNAVSERGDLREVI